MLRSLCDLVPPGPASHCNPAARSAVPSHLSRESACRCMESWRDVSHDTHLYHFVLYRLSLYICTCMFCGGASSTSWQLGSYILEAFVPVSKRLGGHTLYTRALLGNLHKHKKIARQDCLTQLCTCTGFVSLIALMMCAAR